MPKNALQGLTTDSGWYIEQRIDRPLGSGGNFCTRYVAHKDGKVGFLKAMDLSGAMNDIREAQKLINQYVFEQDILEFCRGQRMTRVVTPLDAGVITLNNFQPGFNTVHYVVFEKAEGDLRSEYLQNHIKNWLPAFKALHHAVTGVNQLHKGAIAHQDIKPSNVLTFEDTSFKVSDLGRVVDSAGASPFSLTHFPGDLGYRPVEMEFGLQDLSFTGRLSCDMFMLGSLVFHLIEDVQLNIVIMDEIYRMYPRALQMDYANALPFVISSFTAVMSNFKEDCTSKFGSEIADVLHSLVFEMCNPILQKRGRPNMKNDVVRLQLDRYISKLDWIVTKAKLSGIR